MKKRKTQKPKPVKAWAWAWQSKSSGDLAIHLHPVFGTSLSTAPTKEVAKARGVNHETHRLVRVTITVED